MTPHPDGTADRTGAAVQQLGAAVQSHGPGAWRGMGASSPLILDVDAEVAGHIAVALRAYTMKSRRDYRAVPPELDAIGEVMAQRAMRRQQATPLEDLWRVQQAEHVAPRLMSIPQAAHMLQCSVRTLQRRIACGSLPAVHNGGLTRIRVEDLDDYLSGLAAVGA